MHFRQTLVNLICLVAATISNQSCFSQLWLNMDQGFGCVLHGTVIREIFADSENDLLYVSGELFSDGYCEEWRNPGVWNGQAWERVGDEPAPSIYFHTIGNFRGNLYSSNLLDYFAENYFVQWNGSSWDYISPGPNGALYSMVEHNDYLYVSGVFNRIGETPANLVFRYDGETIEPLVDSFAQVAFGNSIAFYDDTLFVGGSFFNYDDQVFHLGSVFNNRIHRVGQGLNWDCLIETLCVHDGVLWLGGYFGPGNFDAEQHYYLAYYDGYTIRPAPWQPDGRVVELTSYNNELYLAGWFAHIEELESHGIAKINDFGYYALNPDTLYRIPDIPGSYSFDIVETMEIWNDTLYIGGNFTAIGSNTELNRIAKLNRALTAHPQDLADDLLLYPNPALNEIALQTNTFFNQDATISIFDASGRLVQTGIWTMAERRKQLQVNHLQNGVYLIRIETESASIVKRFVKQ